MKNPVFTFKNNEKVEYKVYYGKPVFKYKKKGRVVKSVVLGTCDNPERKNPKITIKKTIKPKRELSIILEECYHAFFWDKLEKEVRPYCTTVAKMLYEQGWRKIK